MIEEIRNVADPKQVADSETKERRKRERELNDVRAVLNLAEGRRFLWRYLSLCDRISAVPNGSMTYFNEGERNIALKIKADIVEASPKALLTMMKEAKEGEKKDV